MTIETIFIARHGFRLSWETQIWTSPTGTPRDPPLSAHGVDQVKELAAWFAHLPAEEKPEVIYSSPLYRCLQTATPTAEALTLPIICEHGIGEWYLPVRRGLHPRSLPSARLHKWFPLIKSSSPDVSLLYPSQKGETKAQVHVRAAKVLALLIAKIERDTPHVQRVVLFTHAATNVAMGRALVGDLKRDIRSGCCSVGKYERAEGDGKLGSWVQTLNGDCSFLDKGEERHWDFSFVEEYEEDGVLPDGTDAPLASERYAPTPVPAATSGKL